MGHPMHSGRPAYALRLFACVVAGSALACAGVAVVLVVSVGLWWVGGMLAVLGAVVALGGVG